jgi:pimeloyl-ACP methyl ester carboxylesterase
VFTTIVAFCLSATAQSHITGTLPDGATYVIDVPAKWNGTLLLYSHGIAWGPNPARNATDPLTHGYLLRHGYALAGSSYATVGWAVHEAIPDQIATLDVFASLFGTPIQTIAWGHSMGGLITAGLVQRHPNRFAAALPMCGILGGSVGYLNTLLDMPFTFNTLIAGGTYEVVHVTNPNQDSAIAQADLTAAQLTPQGQARIALIAAMYDAPDWVDPSSPEPAPTDYASWEANQFLVVLGDLEGLPFVRVYLEALGGGNPSWNTGVNYATQLKRSEYNAEVQALYAAAGLSLDADLATLENAARIASDPKAEKHLSENIILNGQISIPVLTLHTTDDPVISVEHEQAYAAVVRKAGNQSLLRQRFIHRAGHCQFTPAEMIAGFETLFSRMVTGEWNGLSPATLNAEATAAGPKYNVLNVNGQWVPTPPAFETFQSPPFLRPFDAFSH